MSNTRHVVGLHPTTTHMTVYFSDGLSIIIPQGDSRIINLLNHCREDIENQGYSIVPDQMLEERCEEAEIYKTTQQISKVVSFFRVARKKLSSILGLGGDSKNTHTDTEIIGRIPSKMTQEEKIEEVMKHAVPLDKVPSSDSDETIIAVSEGAVIPEANKLINQISHVAENPDRVVGFNAFMKRLSDNIETVQHTAQDVLDFVQKNNMPIADDGAIITFKRVNTTADKGVFVDCHTRKVKQRVGDIVQMDVDQVDPNRHVDCSKGLHVARWDYLRSFTGSAMLMCKLYPEHIVAVPHGDPSKVRASQYTILLELSEPELSNVMSSSKGLTMTETGKAILAQALVGVFDPKDPGYVHIDENNIVYYTAPKGNQKKQEKAEVDTSIAQEVAPVVVENIKATPVDIRQIAQGKKMNKPSRQETMQKHIDLWLKTKSQHDLRKIREYKRKSKVSWEKLGVASDMAHRLTKLIKDLD